MLAELLIVFALVIFLLRFPRLLLRTWATGRYGGFGGTHKPRVRTGPGLFVSVLQGIGQLARYIAERILEPAAAAGNHRVLAIASQRRAGSNGTWTDRLRQWHYHWTVTRSTPQPTQPGFLDYTPDEFDPWGRL